MALPTAFVAGVPRARTVRPGGRAVRTVRSEPASDGQAGRHRDTDARSQPWTRRHRDPDARPDALLRWRPSDSAELVRGGYFTECRADQHLPASVGRHEP